MAPAQFTDFPFFPLRFHKPFNPMEHYDVIVIGAGASGMMAAARSAECGARTLLLEKTHRAGNKLLISGKGRCNFTNTADLDNFVKNFSKSGLFLYNAFGKFFNKDLINFFESLGLDAVVERGGRVFPKSNQASSVVAALKKYMDRYKVKVKLDSAAKQILAENGCAVGVELKNGQKILSKKVILATGGMSYPGTGSCGDGFKMAKQLGHNIIAPKPGLVPLETQENFAKKLQGLTLENVSAAVFANGKKIEEEFGDLIFTHFGISGPVILTLSSAVVKILENGESVYLSINLKPALTVEQLDNRLVREFNNRPNAIFKNILKNLMPKRLVDVFVKLSGIPQDLKVNQITKRQRRTIVKLLTNLRLTITKTRPIEEAIITKGGVATDEINPQTMESERIKNLYFCGEVIDVDAKTGGFNLQAAFSTGRIAGENAAK